MLLTLSLFSSCFEKKVDIANGGNFKIELDKKTWSLSDSGGKVRVLYFGFTSCPDICPTALQVLGRELNKLDKEIRSKVQPIFISLDYKRDRVKDVEEYATYFGSDFVGLVGNEKETKNAASLFGVHFEFTSLPESKMGYTIDHTSKYYLIDQKGKLVKSYSMISSNSDFLEEIKKLAI